MKKMLVCHCTLCHTNPEACKSCSRWNEAQSDQSINPTDSWRYIPSQPGTVDPWEPSTTQPQPFVEPRQVKKITKTIEKYDKDGNYKGKKVVTTEEEIVNIPVWTGEIPWETSPTISVSYQN